MKVSLFKSLLVAAATVVLFASCGPKQESVRVGLDATSPSFVDGKVDLIVALSGQSATNVGVTLTASGSIPASSLTFEKNPSIPAGTTSKTVSVTVDESTLEPGDYEATFSISSVTGADINVAKQSVTVKLTVEAAAIVPEVFISSYSDAFADGKASLKLALSQAAESDVVVNLKVETEMDGYSVLPASALTFTNPATIPAGSLDVTVEVSLDESVLEAGVSYYAILTLASVSENAKLASTKKTAYIEASKALTANLRSDWTVSFDGTTTTDGKVSQNIKVDGVGAEGTYYLFVYSKGVVAEEFDDITEYLVYMEEKAVGPALGTADAYPVKTGNSTWPYTLNVGEYEVWLVGCTAAGHVSGDYATSTFKVEPTSSMLDAYDNWLGDWYLNRTAITIVENDRSDVSYTIQAGDYFIDANLGWNGELQFFVTDPCTAAGGEGFFGYYPAEEEGYINIYSGTAAIGYAVLDETMKAGTVDSTNDGYFLGMAAFTYNETSFTGWGDLEFEFPTKISRPVEDIDPNYTKWLGTWNIEGFSTPLTIAQDMPNESYTLGLFYPSISVTYAYVDFNAETGGLEFNFGAAGGAVTSGGNNYTLYLSGITNDNYVAMGSSDSDLLATATLGSDEQSATIEPNHWLNSSSADTYPVSLGLLGYNSSEGWSNFGMLFNIPTTMTKAEAEPEPTSRVRANASRTLSAGVKVNGARPEARRIANARR
ncbi:MAG: hypothetical protein K6A64_09855 [Bacteroidales bacterium]|nr:hypothetical protein [Bacteroidales bacterium]